ncbi:hypothetical protein HAP41_0000016280 [Bradyrhizobium barranii subsp. apii]|uniref:Uncharacterized protein n=1 Tax=Bradyrhizobium barranii subsp. apii TaxID=2819348 RepID=A0A8T5VCY4_9BRAD|nr:hypothetical protein [Bradyrhizobium barranii]UPT90353.1 hypothetical protein HAP41_0000016280 [Bradyrhizobium barranii subsp. apii]
MPIALKEILMASMLMPPPEMAIPATELLDTTELLRTAAPPPTPTPLAALINLTLLSVALIKPAAALAIVDRCLPYRES